jgi:hypothetical protein
MTVLIARALNAGMTGIADKDRQEKDAQLEERAAAYGSETNVKCSAA